VAAAAADINIKPEDSNEKVDEHDSSDEDVDEEQYKCEPRLSRAARHIFVIQVNTAISTAAVHVA